MNVYIFSTALFTAACCVICFLLANATRLDLKRTGEAAKRSERAAAALDAARREITSLRTDCDRNRESIARLNGRIGHAARKARAPTDDGDESLDDELAATLALQKAGGTA